MHLALNQGSKVRVLVEVPFPGCLTAGRLVLDQEVRVRILPWKLI